MKKVAFYSLGCKVNTYETDSMKQQLSQAGYELVPFKEGADVYVINTCTVTNIADRKSRQMLHKAKKLNPDAIVVATGCYAQSSKEDLVVDDCIDVILGNNQKGRILEMLEQYDKEKDNNLFIDINEPCEYESLSITEITGHKRAYIKIQDGCNHFCSYCIIPFARGRVRSRSYTSIMEEVTALARKGVKEVILTGIQISSYGIDFGQRGVALIRIIKNISKIDGISRIRLGSLEPTLITDEFASTLSSISEFCPHFHLSLQSGSDTVLKRMNRHYNSDKYFEACRTLHKYFDNPAITTDIIVGFPGETQDEFLETVEFTKKVGLAQSHIFKYSPRKNTKAITLANQVKDTVKNERSSKLIEVCEKLEYNYISTFLQVEEEILAEEHLNIDGIQMTAGYTKRYVRIAIKGNHKLNELLKVRATKLLSKNKILYAEKEE